MPSVYSYTFTSEGHGPWWGIRCSKQFYQETIRQMNETQRCFVYLTNSMGETLAIAVEGPYSEEGDDNVFVPPWVLTRLGLYDGEEIVMDAILEPLPKGTSVRIKPLRGSTVEGPMFIEGITEALNQLGLVQEGLLSAVVDPSMPELHEFLVEGLEPARVCLADGELSVDLERAVDRPATPDPLPTPVFDDDCECEHPEVTPSINKKGYVAFGGTGYRLDGK
jgi:hypothetical protein